MAEDKLIMVDGIKWWETGVANYRLAMPVCPKDHQPLTPMILYHSVYSGGQRRQQAHNEDKSIQLKCEVDGQLFDLPRTYGDERKFVLGRIDAQVFAKMKTINLDDSMIPVADEELKDSDYWVKAKVTESKSGTRLIVWAGSKKDKNKAQLFVEPELKRMSFDQNDDHPLEVFAKVEATFAGKVKSSIEKE